MERTLVGIDFVVRTKNQSHLDVYHFVTGEEATFHRILDSLLNRLDVFARNRTAGNVVLEYKAFARRRLNFDFNVSVLAATTSLLLINFLAWGRLRNRFAVSNLRLTDIGFNAKLALHAVD